MSHGLRGQIALVHALGTVFTGRSTVFVDAFRLAFPAADARAAGSQGS